MERRDKSKGKGKATDGPEKRPVNAKNIDVEWNTAEELADHIIYLNKAEHPMKALVVLFHGPWSKQSQMFLHHIDGIITHFAGSYKVVFLKILVDREMKYMAHLYNVKTYPSIVIFRKDEKVDMYTLQHDVMRGIDVVPEGTTVDYAHFSKIVVENIARALQEEE